MIKSILSMSLYTIIVISIVSVIHYYTAIPVVNYFNISPLVYTSIISIAISFLFHIAIHKYTNYRYVAPNVIKSNLLSAVNKSFIFKIFNPSVNVYEITFSTKISDDTLFNEAEALCKLLGDKAKHIDLNGSLYRDDEDYAAKTKDDSITVLSFVNTLDHTALSSFLRKLKGTIILIEKSKVKGIPKGFATVNIDYKWIKYILK